MKMYTINDIFGRDLIIFGRDKISSTLDIIEKHFVISLRNVRNVVQTVPFILMKHKI